MAKASLHPSRQTPRIGRADKAGAGPRIAAKPKAKRQPKTAARRSGLRHRRGPKAAGFPFKSLALSRVYQVIEPGPVVLLSTVRDGRPNLMTMSWHMMVDFEPPLIACIVSAGDYSFAALSANRECVVAIPDVALADKTVKIGNCHGNVVDKFARFKLTGLPAVRVAAPLVAECFVNLECKVVDISLVEAYGLFVLQVVRAWAVPKYKDAKAFHHCGYGKFIVDGHRLKLPSRMR